MTMMPLSKRTAPANSGFMKRLRTDATGNTLMIVAGAILPLTAMIGAGVDTSRTYLVKSRLQQACDAGALAARKFMGGSTSLTSDTSSKAQSFFGNNFPTGTYGSTDISFSPTRTDDGQIRASATAKVPMTLMTIFGNTSTTVNVNCDAKLEIGNSDIMFVLDITGSMACAPEDTSAQCSTYINSGGGLNRTTGEYIEKSNSRIKGLREAVLGFYDELDSAVSDSSIVRYGIVPYSSSVNLGTVGMDAGSSTPGILRPEWIVDNWAYQSRDANMTTENPIVGPSTDTTEVYSSGASISAANCADYGRNKYPTNGGNPITTGTRPAPVTSTTYTNNATAGQDFGYPGALDTNGTFQSCRRKKSVAITVYEFKFTNWTYQNSSINVSDFKRGTAVNLANNASGNVEVRGTYTLRTLAAAVDDGSESSIRWKGCIEERDTDPDTDFSSFPSTKYDLDIDSLPGGSDETKWRPAIPEMVWGRTNTAEEDTTNNGQNIGPSGGGTGTSHFFNPTQINTFHSCNKRAWKLGERTRSEMEDYVNASSFKPHGGTYHDIGMIWGARLISPTGIFASENATAANGRPIDRHIIFMTDGDMAPNANIYGMYGFEKLDQRVSGTTPTTSDLKDRHNARFVKMCDAARAKGISIWVVGFSQALTTQLTSCADPGKAFTSNNTEELKRQFRLIASRIAQLRLQR